jgi:hypothetical protein
VGITENGSEWHKRVWFQEGHVKGRCLGCVLSLGFECTLDFEGVRVISSRPVKFFLTSLILVGRVFCHTLISADFSSF